MLLQPVSAVSGTELAYAATTSLRDVLSWRMALQPEYAMCGTELAYGATSGLGSTYTSTRPSLASRYGAALLVGSAPLSLCTSQSDARSCLHTQYIGGCCYAVSGTERAYGAMAGGGAARSGADH
eukprot:3791422-Rhodomonas_salina.3